MIKFRELRIDNKENKLIIDVEVVDKQSNVFLNNIFIDTQDTYSNDGVTKDTIIATDDIEDETKTLRLILSSSDRVKTRDSREITFPSPRDTFFVIRVITINEDTGDTQEFKSVIYNTLVEYNNMMNVAKQVLDKNRFPRDFVMEFLKYKAIRVSIESGNIVQAISFYKKFIEKPKVKVGCHERCLR